MRRSFSVLLLASTALGLAAPAANAGEVYLCELDRSNTPQVCFYVKKSDLERLVRTYSQGTINPVRPTPTTSQTYSTGGPVAKPSNCDQPGGPRCQPLWGDPIGYPGIR